MDRSRGDRGVVDDAVAIISATSGSTATCIRRDLGDLPRPVDRRGTRCSAALNVRTLCCFKASFPLDLTGRGLLDDRTGRPTSFTATISNVPRTADFAAVGTIRILPLPAPCYFAMTSQYPQSS